MQTHQHWTWQPFSLQQQQQLRPAWLHCSTSVAAGAAAAIAAQSIPPFAAPPLHSCLTGMASRSAAPPCCCMAPWLTSWRPCRAGAPGLCSWTGLAARTICAPGATCWMAWHPVPGLPAQAPGPHPAHAGVVPEPHQLQPVHGLPAGQELWRSPRRPSGALQPRLQLSLHTSLSTVPACHALHAQEQPQACLPQHCRPLLSNNPTAAGRHRPQGVGLHMYVAQQQGQPVPRQCGPWRARSDQDEHVQLLPQHAQQAGSQLSQDPCLTAEAHLCQ